MGRHWEGSVRIYVAIGSLAVLSSLLPGRAVTAQETTGKVQGTVRSPDGVPLPIAQVFIVGTAFGAATDLNGYYFLNNVPIGGYTLRVQLIGYKPVIVQGARVLGGQTIDVNVTLEPAPVTVTGVTVTAASNVVPRDQVTSKSIVSGTLVNDLPVSDTRDIITLQAGVVDYRVFQNTDYLVRSGGDRGPSLRGSRPGEAQVYIDGAPVRALYTGAQRVEIGTNAVEEATVTTGAIGVELGNAQAGAISFTTRSGGDRLAGSVAYETDEPLGNALSLGLNRFEGAIGGPVPIVPRLRFFASGVLQGQRAIDAPWGWDHVPSYVVGGADTIVTQADSSGTRSVTVPRYVQVTGHCPGGSDNLNPARDAILKNYGFDCQGGRLPMSWQTNAELQAKLSYSYGLGSSISLTGLANGTQTRQWPGSLIGDPALFLGEHRWSRAVIVNAQHTVFQQPDRALALTLNLSWQQDNLISGALDPSYEASTRSPGLGIALGAMRFAGLDALPFPVTDRIVRNFRTGRGLRSPFELRSDLSNRQPYRLNPYGLIGGSWPTTGFDVGFSDLFRESRLTGRLVIDWQANRYQRVTFGGDRVWPRLAEWRGSLNDPAVSQAFIATPVLYGVFAEDRLDLGDIVLELGLRYDYYDVRALYPNTPGRVASRMGVLADTNDAAYAASLDSVFTESVGHATLSPRLRVSFPVTERTDFRLSYGQQVQAPDFLAMLRGTNADNPSVFQMGRDVDFAKTILTEFGIRHAFPTSFVLDVSAYNKAFRSELSLRQISYDDPLNPGRNLTPLVLTNQDFGYARGFEVKLDWRPARALAVSASYTFQASRGTGSDPLSYFNYARYSQVLGALEPPVQAVQPTDFERPHNLVGSLSGAVPPESPLARLLGGALRDVSVFATFRYVSGLPYTKDRYTGTGVIAPPGSIAQDRQEPVNSSRLPATKLVDLRATKTFTLARLQATAYLDARNLFNFKNLTGLFSETGGLTNEKLHHNLTSPELDRLHIDAAATGALLQGDAVDVRGCATWQPNPVDCVALNRAEARFGNGDGLYTLDEQTRAFNAWYELFNGAQTFYGSPRRIRLGVELTF